MQEPSFDALAQSLASVPSRRQMLKVLLGAAVGGIATIAARRPAAAVNCTTDNQCNAGNWCQASTGTCMAQLPNGAPIPTDPGHNPPLNGTCTPTAGAVVCASGVCDASDNRCGLANGDGTCTPPNGGVVCRSGVCDADFKCGYASGDGPCTSANGPTVCRSGVCGAGNVCTSSLCAGVVCAPSDQCHAAGTCDPTTGQCTNPPLPNGTACNDGNACTQTDTCQSGVCTGGNPVVCTASDQCHVAGTCNPSTGVCSNPAAADGTNCTGSGGAAGRCTAGVCTPNCTPITTCPAGACGTISNGCGGTLTCGTCTAPQTCGGGGTPSVCGCTCQFPAPTNKAQCMNGGWQTLSPAAFKNQGQCIAYVESSK